MTEYLNRDIKNVLGKENFFLIAGVLLFILIEPFNSHSLTTTFFNLGLAISISSILTAIFYA